MLTPEQVALIGASTEALGDVEGAALSALVSMCYSGALSGDLAQALEASPQVAAAVQLAIAKTPGISEAAVAAEVGIYLGMSIASDAAALHTTARAVSQVTSLSMTGGESIAVQVGRLVRRDNLSMAEDARRTWVRAVSKYMPSVTSGTMSSERAVQAIAKECARAGVKSIDYASGIRTSVDVAARRHMRTLTQQAAAERTIVASAQIGDGLVEVTSHVAARPSHREWQGRCYSATGRKVVGGVTYDALADATGYGTVWGLCGANCRHSFGPWVHGDELRYSTTPDEDMGLDPDETYAATQTQRAYERAIRSARQQVAAIEGAGGDASSAQAVLDATQTKYRTLLKENRKFMRASNEFK